MPSIFSNSARPQDLRSIADVKLMPFWLDDPTRPSASPPLTSNIDTDLAIVGGGFTGLWTALQAKQDDPQRDVVLLEAGEIACGASGRNGGFVSARLTHSFQNGLQRWPREFSRLLALGEQNLAGIEQTIHEYQIDCDYIRSGELNVALAPHELDDMRDWQREAARFDEPVRLFDGDQVRAIVNSPMYIGGALFNGNGMVNPARLAWGLRRACLGLGVRLFEGTQVQVLEERENFILLKTSNGEVRAQRVALATNAFPPLLKRLSLYVVPVYDYVIMSERLSSAQRDAIGWRGREGLSDSANQFHYSQITSDGRILWGGYDAVYYRGNRVAAELENRPESFGRLAGHFFQTFPQLEGLRFTHAWGGVIDTCSRYSVFWGKALHGRAAYALGYTGLGVGASRFGARVMLDLLDHRSTQRTSLQMVKSKPIPFPPEPLRSLVVNFTRWSLGRADANNGRRNWWLKLLDSIGLGFDS